MAYFITIDDVIGFVKYLKEKGFVEFKAEVVPGDEDLKAVFGGYIDDKLAEGEPVKEPGEDMTTESGTGVIDKHPVTEPDTPEIEAPTKPSPMETHNE